MITLHAINNATQAEFMTLLDGVYEHSPWIAEQAWHHRPFKTIAALKLTLVRSVREATEEQQIHLIKQHPELAGKAAVAKTLTPESRQEQQAAGLSHCAQDEYDRLQKLNAAYLARFGWPFILAVRGPRGTGLTRREIIETFDRRLQQHPDDERRECLRQVHRIAELRLNDKFGHEPTMGHQVWDWAEALSQHSDRADNLTVTYLTDAHRACSGQLSEWMAACGFDDVSTDAVGNVVGLYRGADATSKRLLTGSHFDTVRNAGKYDGRLGIFVPMAAVRALHQARRRLPFGIEVVAFAEEEGQRFPAAFLASSALVGGFDRAWLDRRDAAGTTMREAMQRAGLDDAAIGAIARDRERYLGFVEVHIEQGPVLNELDLPLGVVTSINGSVRCLCEALGTASHAGTTPMDRRRDAALLAAEVALYVERRAASVPDVVGTVGMLEVPNGSINVIPGRCRFSLDLRATTDEARDALADDVLAEVKRIAERRGMVCIVEESMRVPAAPSAPAWQERWERAVAELGLPVRRLPSGAGHDAMKLHHAMAQAMLFVRGGNGGISHNPLETITSDDAELAVQAFATLLEQLAADDRAEGITR
jgi:N-carbamoyl-L-amino-acid hydrolase